MATPVIPGERGTGEHRGVAGRPERVRRGAGPRPARALRRRGWCDVWARRAPTDQLVAAIEENTRAIQALREEVARTNEQVLRLSWLSGPLDLVRRAGSQRSADAELQGAPAEPAEPQSS